MILDLSSLLNAILRLDEGIQRYHLDTSDKMLKRFLESTSPSPAEIDALAFQDLIRTGNEQGLLLSDWTVWKKYREMRSKTSHTYDESIALQVVAEIPAFLNEAQYLAQQLQARNK